MRERRHNRPIDIVEDFSVRARRDYDSSVPIVLPDPGAITPKMLNDTLDLVLGFDAATAGFQVVDLNNLKIKGASTTVSLRTGDAVEFTYKADTGFWVRPPLEAETLVVTKNSIEKLSSFQEPQANGAMLKRWEVGYWCDKQSPLSRPGGKRLLCQQSKDDWVSFQAQSYSTAASRNDEMLFIQVWGY